MTMQCEFAIVGNVATCRRCRRQTYVPHGNVRIRGECHAYGTVISLPTLNKRNVLATCRFLGEQVGLRTCHSCRGNIQVKEFACHHPAHSVTTLKECQACSDYNPPTGAIRHLLFHLWPNNETWRWNVEQFLKRIDLFNGHRIVALAGRDEQTKEAEEILSAKNCHIVRVENEPQLREVASFDALFQCVETTAPGHVTFWCHSKGGLHGLSPSTQAWTEMMWEQLDFWPETQKLLEQHPVCGMFKKHGRGFAESESRWHYSGSFFWFRNRDLFSQDWRHIDRMWFGIETYPSLHFHHNQAACLFGAWSGRLNLYFPDWTLETMKPAWEQWKREHSR